jgi:hypothetical protein
LFIDGYAHSEIIDTDTEDLFTPWHAIFYSGFISTAATIACIARKRATDAAIRTWFPPGYGLAALGIGVFAILSTPVRAAWLDPRPRRGWRQLGIAVISVAITTALIAFFLEYAFGITETWPQQQPFDDSNSDDERVVGLALATGYAANTVLVAPVLIFLRRRNAPMGAGGRHLGGAGAVGDARIRRATHRATGRRGGRRRLRLVSRVTIGRMGRRAAIILTTSVAVAVLWTTWMASVHVDRTVRRPPELWSGQNVMNVFIGFVLAAIVFPGPAPVETAGRG